MAVLARLAEVGASVDATVVAPRSVAMSVASGPLRRRAVPLMAVLALLVPLPAVAVGGVEDEDVGMVTDPPVPCGLIFPPMAVLLG